MFNQKKGFSVILMVAVLSIFIAGQSTVIINPALNGLSTVYADVTYSGILLLSTIVSLFSMIFSIISGQIVEKYVSYKNLTILAIVLLVAGGMLPLVSESYYFAFAMRVVVGVGTGLIIPLGNALVFRLFDREQAVNLQGLSTLVMNIGGIVLQSISGYLCSLNPTYTWFTYAVLLLPLFLVILFLKEPEKLPEQPRVDKKEREKLPLAAYVISFGYAINFLLIYPLMLNMSTILVDDNLGDAGTAGIILSLYTLGGMLAGVVFGKIYQKIRRFMPVFSFALETCGLAFVAFGNSILLLGTGTLICGFAVFTLFPTCMSDFGILMPQSVLSKASGFFMAAMTLGAFIASPYISLVYKILPDASARTIMMISTCGAAILGICWTIGRLKLLKNEQ